MVLSLTTLLGISLQEGWAISRLLWCIWVPGVDSPPSEVRVVLVPSLRVMFSMVPRTMTVITMTGLI